MDRERLGLNISADAAVIGMLAYDPMDTLLFKRALCCFAMLSSPRLGLIPAEAYRLWVGAGAEDADQGLVNCGEEVACV